MSKRKKPAPTRTRTRGTAEPHGIRPGGARPHGTEVDYDDHDLLGQADWVIGGEAARKARQQGLYAGYVLFLGALVYGLPIVQAVFRTSDASSLGDQLRSPVAIALLVASVGGAARRGRLRRPLPRARSCRPCRGSTSCCPSPLDRALALRRWWRYAAVGGLFVGALSGLTDRGRPGLRPPRRRRDDHRDHGRSAPRSVSSRRASGCGRRCARGPDPTAASACCGACPTPCASCTPSRCAPTRPTPRRWPGRPSPATSARRGSP